MARKMVNLVNHRKHAKRNKRRQKSLYRKSLKEIEKDRAFYTDTKQRDVKP